MNRNERRRLSMDLKKDTNTINSLSPAQARLIDTVTEQRALEIANRYMGNFEKLLDRNMSAALIMHDIELPEIEEIQETMSELLLEDSEKSRKLDKECVDMLKIQNEVEDAVEVLLNAGTVKKEIVDQLMCKFPKLSRSMILNAYAKIKKRLKPTESRVSIIYKDFEENSNKLSGKQMIAHAMSEFKIEEGNATTYYYKWKKQFMGTDKVVPTTAEEISKEDKENAEKIINKAKEMHRDESVIKDVLTTAHVAGEGMVQAQIINKSEGVKMSDLRVIEEKVIKTIKVQGDNGEYAAETEKGVKLSKDGMNIKFKSIEELDAWTFEYKQAFALILN